MPSLSVATRAYLHKRARAIVADIFRGNLRLSVAVVWSIR
jgi:hypothetical protein